MLVQWLVAMLFSGALLRLFRWLLRKQRPAAMWRYGVHGFALGTALVLSTVAGVGGADPGLGAFVMGCILYAPAQVAWIAVERWRPNIALTGLA